MALGVIAIAVVVVLVVFTASVRVVQEYERGVIFRLGRVIAGAKGPGLFLIIPIVDRMVKVNLQIVTLDVPPQDVITKDNVTVRVHAVCYFQVFQPVKATVEIQNYFFATSQIAQTTLRAVLSKVDLDEILTEPDRLSTDLQRIIDDVTEPWGIKVARVEIKDVDLPVEMQRAMARQPKPSESDARRSSTPKASSRPPNGSRRQPRSSPGTRSRTSSASSKRSPRSPPRRTRRSSSRSRSSS